MSIRLTSYTLAVFFEKQKVAQKKYFVELDRAKQVIHFSLSDNVFG
jgi:hypothetical protein